MSLTKKELEAVLAENADTAWSGAEVVAPDPDRKVTVVHSTRLPAEFSKALEVEAARRGISPSKLMQIYVVAGLSGDGGQEVVTILGQRLHQALDEALRHVA